MDDRKSRLREILLRNAVRFGEFNLASGQKSNYYINGKMVTLDCEGLYLVAEIMLDKLAKIRCDAVGGLTLGADPIVGAMTALAFKRGRELCGFIVRKEPKTHGTQSQVEGPLKPGAKVAIVEDVSTTGSSASKAIEVVKSLGCEVVRILVMVDRQEGAEERFREMKIPFDPIFRKEELGL